MDRVVSESKGSSIQSIVGFRILVKITVIVRRPDSFLTTMPLLDPRNDFVFKRLFTEAPAQLSDLINAIRSDEAPIRIDEIRNPRIDPEQLAGKFIVLDVLAIDAAGARYDIEMQVRRHADWHERTTYYLARTYVDQLRGGENYGEIVPTIGIHLMGFDLFTDPAQARWCFEIRDRDQPRVRLRTLQWNMIELPKGDRLLAARSTEPFAAWVTFFQHAQDEAIMSTITHPPVQQALDELKRLSADEEARHLAMLRERALRDEASFVRDAKAEGLTEGLTKGRTEVARRLIARLDLDDAAIAELTGLGEDEVSRLRRSATD
ncbi:MAG: Rpn family recombination-promoting nuclease/putative transposase [Burkholderiaceae bacterium]